MLVPVVSFIGFSGSGKTSLIEAVVPRLKKRGLKVAVIKHAPHGFDIDQPGKDSWRYNRSGSDIVGLTSPGRLVLMENTLGEPDLVAVMHSIQRKVDIILLEGYKKAKIPKIEVRDGVDGPGLSCREEELIAIVTAESVLGRPPRFNPEEVDFVVRRLTEMATESLRNQAA